MKKIFIVVALFIFTHFTAAYAADRAEQELDQVIAIVNDDIITKSELNSALKTAKMQIDQNQSLSTQDKSLQKQILDQVINRKLQLQVAQQIGIKVTDEDLDKTIEKVAQQNNVSIQNLYTQLTQEGMTKEQYRNEMRDQLTLRKVQQQEVVSRLSVTPQEVDYFLKSNTWKTNEAKEYKIDDILIPLSDPPSSNEMIAAKKSAQIIIEKLNKEPDNHMIVSNESNKQHPLQNTNLGWRKLADIPTAFAEEVTHMQPKDIAGPIQTSNGLHIIRLVDLRTSITQQTPPDLKQAEELLLERKFEEAVQHWMSKLRHQAYIVNKLSI